MPNPDRMGFRQRQRHFLHYRGGNGSFVGFLGASGVGVSVGNGDAPEAEADTAPYVGLHMDAADEHDWWWIVPFDLNPLHLDPEAAKRGGFDRPILHGLCTYGFATRAIVNGLLQGDVSRFKEFKARFSDVVYPGEQLTTSGWEDNGRYIIQVNSDRAVVICNAMVKIT